MAQVPIRIGYKASAEQFAPRELLEYSLLAERLGFDTIAISDHFQPWRHHGGHAPAAPAWLGALAQASERRRLAEAVELIRRLWTEERVDFDGRWYRTRKATIYDRPQTPVPIFIAASG